MVPVTIHDSGYTKNTLVISVVPAQTVFTHITLNKHVPTIVMAVGNIEYPKPLMTDPAIS